MPTKPNPVTDLPPSWGGAGNYTPGVYDPTLPWGDANPLAGQPLPWGNQPRLNSTGLAGFANTGLTPQIPTDASLFNEWLRRVGIWATDWVALGTSADDADAHIMETDASGYSRAKRYYATEGVAGLAGGVAVDLLQGFIVPASKTSIFGDSSVTTWGANATISGGSATRPNFAGYQLQSEQGATADRTIHHQGGHPRYRDSGTSDYIHRGTEPWNPTGSVPALDTFGPTSAEIDGPSVSVTLTGTAFVFVAASGFFVGTAGDTRVGIRVEVDGVDVYDEAFDVFNTSRPLVWATTFAVQEGAGTFDVKVKLRRAAGTGSVTMDAASIFAMPT